MSKIINALIVPAFFLSVILIKLPPFYLFPFIPSTLFTTHTLAKVIFLCLTGFLLNRQLTTNNRQQNSKHFFAFFLVFIYFLTQSLSIFKADNLSFFWKQYQNIIASVLIFVSTVYIVQENRIARNLNKFIYYLGIYILAIEALFLFFTDIFSQFLQVAIQKDLWGLYAFNLQKGRHNLFLSCEIFLPFFILALLSAWKNKRYSKLLFNCLFIVLLIVVSLMTNFRTRLVQLAIALIGSFFILLSDFKLTIGKKIIITIFGLLIIGGICSLYFNLDNQRTKNEQLDTVFYRYQGLIKSIDLFKTSPLIGVGLGNYKYYIFHTVETGSLLDKKNYEDSLNSPHSIISETVSEAGAIGLLGWLLIIFYFVRQDMLWIIKKGLTDIFPYQIAFWVVFSYSLTNPFYSIFHIGWFWFLRGIIEGKIND